MEGEEGRRVEVGNVMFGGHVSSGPIGVGVSHGDLVPMVGEGRGGEESGEEGGEGERRREGETGVHDCITEYTGSDRRCATDAVSSAEAVNGWAQNRKVTLSWYVRGWWVDFSVA